MRVVIGDVAVVLVGRREAVDGSHSVGGRRICGSEAKWTSGFVDVAEGIVSECLGCGAAAIDGFFGLRVATAMLGGYDCGANKCVRAAYFPA